MPRLRSLASVLALLSAASLASAAPNNGRVWVSPDFYIDAPSAERSPASIVTEGQDCRATIAAKTCLVEPSSFPMGSRSCLEGSEKYAPVFERLYDEMNPELQGVFCQIQHLYVEQKLDSIAYSGILRNWMGRPSGAVLGIRQSVLDTQLPLSTLLSWKEQLVFGGEAGSYNPVPELPTVDAQAKADNDTLYFVFSHEFGHILDFTHDVNSLSGCILGIGFCRPAGWTKISWTSRSETRFDAVFPQREKIDFYGSGPRMGKNDVAATYNGLLQTDFVSLYSATSPYEDFAESLAFRNLLLKGGTYTNHTHAANGDLVIEASQRMAQPIFKAKRDYIENFLAGLRKSTLDLKPIPLPIPEIRPFNPQPLPFSVPVD